ncbi:hypothetical protein Tco_1501323 [Tanacetum coccineum]
MEGWKPKDLKNKSFTNIQDLFDKAMKRINTFVDMDTKLVKESSKKAEAEIAQESSSKRAGEALEQESSKKQKNILYYLLVEKMYPPIKHTLHQMFNDVKLQVDYECEMAFELLRLVKKQLKEGYGRIVGIRSLLEVTAAKVLVTATRHKLALAAGTKVTTIGVNAAGIKVATAERLQLLKG